MNLTSKIRGSLGLKLFISYLIIIITGVIVLGISAEFVIPTAFNRHMGAMMGEGGMMGGMMMGNMGADLYTNFRSAMGEALLRAGLAAFVVAVAVSIFVSRKVVSPIHEMTIASQYIAEGHYEQRVQVTEAPEDGDELIQLATSFNQMAEKLAQTENMRRQLIGDVSHELRTPLTTIKGSMEGLLDGVLPPTPETYQSIYLEADRLQRLVADLQELSRVEAGAIPLELETSDIIPVLETVTQRMSSQFQEKNISIIVNLPSSLPLVQIDEDRIAQVVINILGNSLQYTPKGGKVSLSAQHLEDVIEIKVEDSGIGIPQEHLPYLFTRFYRVDKSRSRAGGGSGIGLTISKYFVEAHGGRIWAESAGPNQGAIVTFTLPISN